MASSSGKSGLDLNIFIASVGRPDLLNKLKRSLSSLKVDNISVASLLTTEEIVASTGSRIPDLRQEAIALIPEIDILLADPPFITQVLKHPSNKLKWAASTFAGVNSIVPHQPQFKAEPDLVITRTGTGFGQLMAEYVIGFIIARERRFSAMLDCQKQNKFAQKAFVQYRSLDQLSIGILGLGIIGSEVARVCKALNMTVWAAVRDGKDSQPSCDHVNHLRPLSRLSEMLSECDYVVNILPSTPQTQRLLSGTILQPCQAKKSVFINIGRGDVIDDDSLVNALRSGWLGGAILDVFNEEPLPASSPLWSLPGVIISPHVSGVSFPDNLLKCFMDNLERYIKGDDLLYKVDFSKGY